MSNYLTNLNLPPDKFNTGDIVMSRYVWKDMSWKDRLLVRGILATTGAKHNHDENMIRTSRGLYVGNAHSPHYELTSFEDRLAEYGQKIRVCAVFRYTPFMKDTHGEWYDAFQHRCNASILTTAYIGPGYDWQALDRILLQHIMMNWFRKKINLKNKEHRVYCTEGVVLQYKASCISLLKAIGKQPFPSPIHFERLWKLGKLTMIADFGLRDYLLA